VAIEPTAEPTPTVEPTIEPTAELTPEPTAEPTPEPTAEPTPEPTPEPTAEPSPEPTVVPTPSIGSLTRLVVPEVGLGDRFKIPVEILDRTRTVLRAHPADGASLADAPFPAGGQVPVAWNPGGDRHRLGVLWVGGQCERPAFIALTRDRLTLRGWHDPRGCDAIGLTRALVLDLAEPVDAGGLKVAVASDSMPDGCATGRELTPWLLSVQQEGRLGEVVLPGPGIVLWEERLGNGSPGDTQIGLFGDYDPDLSVVAGGSDGSSVLIAAEPTIRVTRAVVTFYDAAGREEVDRVAVEPDAQGQVIIPHPAPGRFATAILARWEHACVTGESVWWATFDTQ
jgi:hypothetical protein